MKKRERFKPCSHPRGELCAANRDGVCLCLNDTEFRNKDCPFFKERVVTEPVKKRHSARNRLI